jgi:hypothetical protein
MPPPLASDDCCRHGTAIASCLIPVIRDSSSLNDEGDKTCLSYLTVAKRSHLEEEFVREVRTFPLWKFGTDAKAPFHLSLFSSLGVTAANLPFPKVVFIPRELPHLNSTGTIWKISPSCFVTLNSATTVSNSLLTTASRSLRPSSRIKHVPGLQPIQNCTS